MKNGSMEFAGKKNKINETNDKQKCPICLEDLFLKGGSSAVVVGAIVPCGHCLHASCYRQWQQADYNQRRMANHHHHNARSGGCRCPICNGHAHTFVSLFLDQDTTTIPDQDSDNDKDRDVMIKKANKKPDGNIYDNLTTTNSTNWSLNTLNNRDIRIETVFPELAATPNTANTAAISTSTSTPTYANTTTTTSTSTNDNDDNDTTELIELLAHHERIQSKLKRYRRRNKHLQQELQAERQDMEDILLSTIQNFYKIMDKHEEERQRWARGAMELRRELDATLAQQQRERLLFDVTNQRMEQDVEQLRRDCQRADQKVAVATEGLAELKLHNRKRQARVQMLLQDKARLIQENRKLKQAAHVVP